jgi:hypothetical protein
MKIKLTGVYVDVIGTRLCRLLNKGNARYEQQ